MLQVTNVEQTKQESLVNEHIRNIAIIAHVDHGKTTLVDFMLRQSGTFRDNQQVAERVMDNMDLERERGITISAKNCAFYYRGCKINLIDTPGHADFGGEVERALKMADGAVLLVDSAEGPLPQTRFVLKKALESNIKIIVVINKIDRKDARPQEVLNEIYDLFIDLEATDEQLDFPLLYAIGRDGIAQRTMDAPGKDLEPLFDMILHEVPAPLYDAKEPFQMLVTNLSYSDYLGRLAIGRVFHGSVHKNENLLCIGKDGTPRPLKVTSLRVYEGLKFKETELVEPGEIVILSGIENVEIGDTICTVLQPKALPRITVDEPTISMKFMPNTSPFSGREGKYVQSRKILERLNKETMHNVGLQLEMDPNHESFTVKGRGEFQMAILIETMRREGYELTVGQPKIIFKEEKGVKLEPIEHLFVDIPEEHLGMVTEKLLKRQGRLLNMINHGSGRLRLEFSIPSRGLIGYRNDFLTDTKGLGVLSSYLIGYEPMRGDIRLRISGSLVNDRVGETRSYALFHLEPRGTLFVLPGIPTYNGMIIGENSRENDIYVNACKDKKQTNVRSSGKDENLVLTPIMPMTLERAISFIREDEYVEVTPKNIRLRKIVLPPNKK